MIMSRGTFVKNIIGSSEFGDKFKMQLTGNEMYMSTGLITSQLASTILQVSDFRLLKSKKIMW